MNGGKHAETMGDEDNRTRNSRHSFARNSITSRPLREGADLLKAIPEKPNAFDQGDERGEHERGRKVAGRDWLYARLNSCGDWDCWTGLPGLLLPAKVA